MYKYILKRLVTLIPVIIGVSFLVYVMLDLAPGTVLDVIGENLSPEEVARTTEELALDRSVFYRYFMYMKGLVRGDLGTSYIYNMEVWDLYISKPTVAYSMLWITSISPWDEERLWASLVSPVAVSPPPAAASCA